MASMPYSSGAGVMEGVWRSVLSRGSLLDFSQRFWQLRRQQRIAEAGVASNVETGADQPATTQESSGETAPATTET